MKILYVEDDEGSQSILRMLCKNKGWDCDCVATAIEAVYMLGVKAYDAVILDYFIGAFTGKDVEDFAKSKVKNVMYYSGSLKSEVKTNLPFFDKTNGMMCVIENIEKGKINATA